MKAPSGADVLEPGRGDDVVDGLDGTDQFIYRRGDGSDVFFESWRDDVDGYVSLFGITPDEVTAGITFEHLVLDIAAREADGSDAGQIILADGLLNSRWKGVYVEFEDGTVWTEADLTAPAIAGLQTASDDHVPGTDKIDRFEPGAGDDLVDGLLGHDVLRYARGDGDDTVSVDRDSYVEFGYVTTSFSLELTGVTPQDVSVLRHGNDMVLRIAESAPGAGDMGSVRFVDGYTNGDFAPMVLRSVSFEDGTLWGMSEIAQAWLDSRLTDGDDVVRDAGPGVTIELGKGDDVVETGSVGDTYVYRAGDGHDVIVEYGYSAYAGLPEFADGPLEDILHFADLAEDKVAFVRDGMDLVARIDADPVAGIEAGSVTLSDAFGDHYDDRSVEVVRFSAGNELRVSDIVAELGRPLGTDGDDVLTGTSGDDQLAGLLGNDVLNGGDGTDVYTYRRGDGDDLVIDTGYNGADILKLEGIAPGDVSLEYLQRGIALTIAESAPGAGDGGHVELHGMLADFFGDAVGVEEIHFDDLTVWDRVAITTRLLQGAGTQFDDVLSGDDNDNILEGREGNDVPRRRRRRGHVHLHPRRRLRPHHRP